MAGKPKTWTDTKLWKELVKRARKGGDSHEVAEKIKGQVEQWLDQIQGVLAQGHTDPQDFTLHDHEHSFRVAERMIELLRPAQLRYLSDYEIALLLLAAYLHDIGMNPERAKINAIHQYLLTGTPGILTPEDTQELQRWLDEAGYAVEPPICRAAPSPQDLDLADEITTYFVRHKHNDWSKSWIQQNLHGTLHHLADWQDTLIRLCQSHHWDHQVLRQGPFDPRRIGSTHPQRLHLRHLACILRVADILENDPERVPHVVFQHRNIDARPRSIVHWQLPHHLSLVIMDDRVHLAAQPLQARMHKAIDSLADAIDNELAGCATIAQQQPFAHCPGMEDVKRDWFLAPACDRDIRPKDNAYDYIEGAFRPNTAKLLQLLSGTQLYENPLDAVRELLQNAFDAVREKIARGRLRLEDPTDEAQAEALARPERVTLTIRLADDGSLHLSCLDTGCGMTREIIQNYLLVSGEARRPSLLDLERQCKKHGFSLNRTGQFGIGVLSYFMLAKNIALTTCRDQSCQDNDAPGWTFSTSGVGDFGELRKLPQQPPDGPGTLIDWQLDMSRFADDMDRFTNAKEFCEAFGDDLKEYLRNTLIRIPCAFRFQTEIDGKKTALLDFDTGWTLGFDGIKTALHARWSKVENEKPEFSLTDSDSTITERQEYHCRLPGWIADARSTLRFEDRIVRLPERWGDMRVVLPWFDLPEGPSLAYVLRDRDQGGRVFADKSVLFADGRADTAWKGMASNAGSEGRRFGLGFIQSDFTGLMGYELQVNRAGLSLPPSVMESCHALAARTLGELADEIHNRHPHAPFYHHLSEVLLQREPLLRMGTAWLQRGVTGDHFSVIELPCASAEDRIPAPGFTTCWRGKPVAFLLPQTAESQSNHQLSTSVRPHRIVARERGEAGDRKMIECAGLWLPESRPPLDDDSVPFPPPWQDVWSVRGIVPGGNSRHSIDRKFQNPAHWAVRLVKRAQPHTPVEDLVAKAASMDQASTLQEPVAAALALMKASRELDHDKWRAIQSRQPSLIPGLFQLCAEAVGQPVAELKLIRNDGRYDLSCLTHDSFHPESRFALFFNHSFLPMVTDPDWCIEEIKD